MALIVSTLLGKSAFGQSPGYEFETGSCPSDAEAAGACSFAQGSGSSSPGDYSVAIGKNCTAGTTSNDHGYSFGKTAKADAGTSISIGCRVSTASTATGNLIFGTATGVTNFSNTISNSIMIGTNMTGTVPTIFVEDGAADSGTWGQVGIGTTEPDGLLHLKDESGDNTELYIEKYSNTDAMIRFYTGNTENGQLMMDDGNEMRIKNKTGNKDIIFSANDGTTQNNIMWVDGSTSNVGIGTSSPDCKLEVNADNAGQEQIAQFGVETLTTQDDNYFRIQNETSTAGDFGVMLKAINNTHSDRTTLMIKAVAEDDAESGDDDPQAAIMQFDSRYSGAASGDNIKPLFVWTENNNGNSKMIMDGSGNVGINTNTPSYLLDVQGSASPVININTNGEVQAAGTVLTSDQIFKTDVDSIENALAIIDVLKPRTYFFDTLNYNGIGKFNFNPARQYGFIAQDVEVVMPELVSISTKPEFTDSLGNTLIDSYEYRGLNYVALIPILTKGIQELQFENEQLNATVEGQQVVINEFNDAVNIIGDQIQQLYSLIDDCCNSMEGSYRMSGDQQSSGTRQNVTLKDIQSIILEQNVPNPFATNTVINYSLPLDAENATVLFHDAIGRLVRSVPINRLGIGSINVFAGDLSNGSYTYTLVVDGEVLESKQMIKSE